MVVTKDIEQYTVNLFHVFQTMTTDKIYFVMFQATPLSKRSGATIDLVENDENVILLRPSRLNPIIHQLFYPRI